MEFPPSASTPNRSARKAERHFAGLLADVKAIAIASGEPGRWQKGIDMLTRQRDAKASDMGNIDGLDEPRFVYLSWTSGT